MNLIELESVDHITVGAVGGPGERTFMLQARSGDETVTVVVEKEHVLLLGRGTHVLLSQVGYQEPVVEPDPGEMALDEAQEPVFRSRSINLGYEKNRDLVMVECEELPETEEEEEEDIRRARFWITRAQLAALGIHGMRIAAGGRPVCPYCWRPMDDPVAHVCRAMNGHAKDVSTSTGEEQ
jgi:uncharacterized repeat protein (TIGR03847 family)